MYNGWLSNIVHFLYPSYCPSCGRVTDNVTYAPFCKGCWLSIRKFAGPSCRVCSAPFVSVDAEICSDCLRNPPTFSSVMSFGLYEGVLAMAISRYKFYGIRRLARPLGRFLLGFDLTGCDAVIPVPLSARGLKARGFNQSLLLSKVVSDKTKLPLIIDGLRKNKETHPQIGLSARERISNVRGAFVAGRAFDGMRVLLIDDVITTGATVNECSRQILEAGATDVVVLSLARASAL